MEYEIVVKQDRELFGEVYERGQVIGSVELPDSVPPGWAFPAVGRILGVNVVGGEPAPAPAPAPDPPAE